jgi:hypothetical protein
LSPDLGGTFTAAVAQHFRTMAGSLALIILMIAAAILFWPLTVEVADNELR